MTYASRTSKNYPRSRRKYNVSSKYDYLLAILKHTLFFTLLTFPQFPQKGILLHNLPRFEKWISTLLFWHFETHFTQNMILIIAVLLLPRKIIIILFGGCACAATIKLPRLTFFFRRWPTPKSLARSGIYNRTYELIKIYERTPAGPVSHANLTTHKQSFDLNYNTISCFWRCPDRGGNVFSAGRVIVCDRATAPGANSQGGRRRAKKKH